LHAKICSLHYGLVSSGATARSPHRTNSGLHTRPRVSRASHQPSNPAAAAPALTYIGGDGAVLVAAPGLAPLDDEATHPPNPCRTQSRAGAPPPQGLIQPAHNRQVLPHYFPRPSSAFRILFLSVHWCQSGPVWPCVWACVPCVWACVPMCLGLCAHISGLCAHVSGPCVPCVWPVCPLFLPCVPLCLGRLPLGCVPLVLACVPLCLGRLPLGMAWVLCVAGCGHLQYACPRWCASVHDVHMSTR